MLIQLENTLLPSLYGIFVLLNLVIYGIFVLLNNSIYGIFLLLNYSICGIIILVICFKKLKYILFQDVFFGMCLVIDFQLIFLNSLFFSSIKRIPVNIETHEKENIVVRNSGLHAHN